MAERKTRYKSRKQKREAAAKKRKITLTSLALLASTAVIGGGAAFVLNSNNNDEAKPPETSQTATELDKKVAESTISAPPVIKRTGSLEINGITIDPEDLDENNAIRHKTQQVLVKINIESTQSGLDRYEIEKSYEAEGSFEYPVKVLWVDLTGGDNNFTTSLKDDKYRRDSEQTYLQDIFTEMSDTDKQFVLDALSTAPVINPNISPEVLKETILNTSIDPKKHAIRQEISYSALDYTTEIISAYGEKERTMAIVPRSEENIRSKISITSQEYCTDPSPSYEFRDKVHDPEETCQLFSDIGDDELSAIIDDFNQSNLKADNITKYNLTVIGTGADKKVKLAR